MKYVFLKLIFVSFGLSISAQAQMASLEMGLEEEIELQQVAQTLYESELKKQDSILSLALAGFAKKVDAVFVSDDQGSPVLSVNFDNLLMVYTGRSGPQAGSVYLAPIMLSYPGSGLIEEVEGFLVIEDNIDIDQDKRVIKIEKIKAFNLYD